jgi:hypothetical protein
VEQAFLTILVSLNVAYRNTRKSQGFLAARAATVSIACRTRAVKEDVAGAAAEQVGLPGGGRPALGGEEFALVDGELQEAVGREGHDKGECYGEGEVTKSLVAPD